MQLHVVLGLISPRHVRISDGTNYLSYVEFYICHLLWHVWSM